MLIAFSDGVFVKEVWAGHQVFKIVHELCHGSSWSSKSQIGRIVPTESEAPRNISDPTELTHKDIEGLCLLDTPESKRDIREFK